MSNTTFKLLGFNILIIFFILVLRYFVVNVYGLNPVIVLTPFVFLAFFFLTLYVRKIFLDPLQEIESVITDVEKGNFDVRLEEQEVSEFKNLFVKINGTIQKLNSLEEERRRLDEAKTQFLSIASHEIRSPLTPMKAQLEMLDQNYFGSMNPKQKESMALILRNADRLNKIIDDMLEVSRIESARLLFTFSKTDVNKLIREVVDYMKGFAEDKNVSFHINAEKLPIIQADRDRIAQVLRNLIGNAIKFVPSEKGVIEIGAKKEGNHILFSVSDNGLGISKYDQRRLFEPFFQIEKVQTRKYGGAGLGLTISKGIVEAQRGKIWLESDSGKGTKFFFTLPLKPVRELLPVRLLFLGPDMRNKELQELFTASIGFIGKKEFDTLQKKGRTSKKDIIDYIEDLYNAGVIEKAAIDKFKEGVEDIFLREKLKGRTNE